MSGKSALIDLLETQRSEALHAAEQVAGFDDIGKSEAAMLEDFLSAADRAEDRLTRIQVRREPVTYSEHGQHSYFLDLIHRRSPDESERLQRHAREMDVELRDRARARDAEWRHAAAAYGLEARDLNRTDGTGGYFVPPLWLLDLYASAPRAGRPLAELVTNIPLPPGTDAINVPRLTTGTSTAPQAADNGQVSETDLVDTYVSAPVRTIAGQADYALQMAEQVDGPGWDRIILGDLLDDSSERLEQQLVNGTGAGGQVVGLRSVSGIGAVTYTDASPTFGEIYPKLRSAASTVATNRKLPPTVALMHPRRWYWLAGEVDANGRPFIDPDGAQAILGGLPVALDATIPTNLGAGTEDVIIATRAEDHLLFTSEPRFMIDLNSSSGTLTARASIRQYVAFTAARHPTATATVSGTGLADPG